MSIYSDYKVGAVSDDEFKFLCNRENAKDRCDKLDLMMSEREYRMNDDEEGGEDE